MSEKIKELRKLTGLTQEQFSKKYEIPKRTIENWESNVSSPPKYVLDLLKFKIEHDLSK